MSVSATVAAPADPTPILPLLPQLAPEIVPGSFSDAYQDARAGYDPMAQLTVPAFTQPPEILAKGKTGTSSWEASNTWFGDWTGDFVIDDNED